MIELLPPLGGQPFDLATLQNKINELVEMVNALATAIDDLDEDLHEYLQEEC